MSLKKKTIALCLGGTEKQYRATFVTKITETCRNYHYQLAYFLSFSNFYDGSKHNRGDLNIYQLINFDEIAAMIIFPETINQPELCRRLIDAAHAANVPVVSVDEPLEDCYNIRFADEEGLEEIITHFIEEHKFTKLNFIAGAKDTPVSDRRLAVYKRVLEEYHIPVEERRIAYGEFWSRPAQEAVELFYWNYNEMPEAFICANDAMALGVVEKLEELGFRVPEDVCVSGFDGIPAAFSSSPKITTTKRYIERAAIAAVDTCIEIIEGRLPSTGTTSIPNKTFFLESCGCNELSYLMDNVSSGTDSVDSNTYRVFSYHMIHMMSRGMEERDFDKTIAAIRSICELLWTKKCWLVLSEQYLQQCETHTFSTPLQKDGYPDLMRVVIEVENHVSLEPSGESFPVSKMLPRFEEEMADYGSVLFAPIHFQDETIGYIALEYHDLRESLAVFETFVFNVGVLLEHIRVPHVD